MTLEQAFPDIKFDKMLPEFRLLAKWVYEISQEDEHPQYIIGKAEFKKNGGWKEYFQAEGLEIDEEFEKKAGKLFGKVNNEYSKDLDKTLLTTAADFANIKKEQKRARLQAEMATPTYFSRFLAVLFKKFSAAEPDVKHFFLSRSPSQMVDDFRWVMRNSIETNERLLSAKDINQKSQICSQWQLGKNVAALDYLLGCYTERTISDLLPPYYFKQLNALMVKNDQQGSTKIFSSLLENCFENAIGKFPRGPGQSESDSIGYITSDPKTYSSFVTQVVLESYQVFSHLVGPENDFIQACQYEAVNDLVEGQLHKLDPVNGDASCQFRVPFVYDLHRAVTQNINMEDANAAIAEYKTRLNALGSLPLSRFMKAKHDRAKNSSSEENEPPATAESASQAGKRKAKKKTKTKKKAKAITPLEMCINSQYVAFNWQVEPYSETDRYELPNFTEESNYARFFRNVCDVIGSLTLKDMTSFDTEKDMPLARMWWKMSDKPGLDKPAHYKTGGFEDRFFHHTSTLRYLTLCKALTVKQMSFCDTFYITVYQDAVLFPYMTEDDCRVTYMELAWYSTCYVKNIFAQMVHATANKEMLDTGLSEDGSGINAATFFNQQLQKTEWYFKLQAAAGPVVTYYENKRMLYMYLFIRKIPIIVDMRRIICEPAGYVKRDEDGYQLVGNLDEESAAGFDDNYKYEYSGGGIYYFEPDHALDRYVVVPSEQLTEEQKSTQGLNIDCYSMFNTDIDKSGTSFAAEKDYSKFEKAWLSQTDLIDQILISTMAHVAATGSTERPADDVKNYLRDAAQKKTASSKKKKDKSKGKKLPAFIKLTPDDVISLYGLPMMNSEKELSRGGETPATKQLMPQAKARIDSIPVDLTGGERGYLPMFANSYRGQQWDVLQERAFIDKLSEAVSYNGYLYQKATNEAKTEYKRSRVTYLLTCRHLYVSTYDNRSAHFEKFKAMVVKPEAEWKVEHPYTRVGDGYLALDFLD